MATVTKPIALDESFNTTELTPRNIADVLAEELSRITGRNASQVEYDNTESGLTADNVQDALDEINGKIPTVPSVNIQTAVDEFETYNGGLLSECKVALSPNQDLHGYDNPWVGGAGKNKFNKNGNLENGKFIQADGTLVSSANWNTTDYQQITPDIYTMSGATEGEGGYYGICWYDSGKTYISGFQRFTTSPQTVTIPSNAQYVRYCVNNSALDSFMLEQGSVATAYEPYENICPISGHTQAKVGDDGKNLFENTLTDGTTYGITHKVKSDGSIVVSGTATANVYVSISDVELEAGTYTASSGSSGSWSTSGIYVRNVTDSTTINMIESENGLTFTLTAKKTIRLVLYVANGQTVNKTFYPMIRLASDTDPTYVPYNGYQITVNLGGTYYSGTLDVVTGVFSPDTAGVDLGTLTWTYEALWGVGSDFYAVISGIKPTSSYDEITTAITEQYKAVSRNTMYNNADSSMAVMTNGAVKIRDNRYPDEASFTSAVSGVKLVYPLATPTPIQLSPTMVKALVGENHLSAPLDGQEITESKYRELFTWDEVEAYVNAHSGGGSGMNYSTDEQVVGTWIDNKPLYAKTIVYTPSGTISSNTTIANVPNAKVMRVTEATAYNPNENRGYTLPDVRANGGTKITYDNGDVTLEIISDSWSSSWTFYVTVQYTKTTD